MVSLFFCLLMIMIWINNPLILCLYLVCMAGVLSMTMYSVMSVWFFNALLLIFLGGMMILFLYLSTLSNNLKFIFPLFSFSSLAMVSLSGLAVGSLNMGGFLFTQEVVSYLQPSSESFSGPSVLFFTMKTPHLTFVVILLLLTLFTVVKLTESFKGSLVKKMKD